MKFGRNLSRNQVPEWATSYIKYKTLKKLIKSAAEEAKQGEGADTAGMSARGAIPLHILITLRVLLFLGPQPGGCRPILQ